MGFCAYVKHLDRLSSLNLYNQESNRFRWVIVLIILTFHQTRGTTLSPVAHSYQSCWHISSFISLPHVLRWVWWHHRIQSDTFAWHTDTHTHTGATRLRCFQSVWFPAWVHMRTEKMSKIWQPWKVGVYITAHLIDGPGKDGMSAGLNV